MGEPTTELAYDPKTGDVRVIEDIPADTITTLKRKVDHLMAELTVLKEAVANVAVEQEAAVAYIATLTKENEELKAAGGTEPAEQEEINELATSATSSADALKAAVPAA